MDYNFVFIILLIICSSVVVVCNGNSTEETSSAPEIINAKKNELLKIYLKSPIAICIGVFVFAVVFVIVVIDCKTRFELKHLKLDKKSILIEDTA